MVRCIAPAYARVYTLTMSNVASPHTPENWGAASRAYAEFAPLMMGCYADEIVERLDIQADTKVLEVAAGTGALTEALARRAGSVLATDFAPGMLDVLEERMEAAGITNVTYAVVDGQALQLDDGTFDRAACCFGMMLFPDRAKGFSELRISLVERTLEMPNFDEWWRMMTAGAPPMKLMFERIGEAGQGRLRDTLAGLVEERFGAGPIRLNNTATLGVGVVPDGTP